MASQLSDVLNIEVADAAKLLLGAYLTREINGQYIVARIVETEAYDESDEASHSYSGMTPRNEIMYGQAGHAYVYFTYGMHFCMNVVTGQVGRGSAVLIRAVEPIEGVDMVSANRPFKSGVNMTNGPAKLCQALQIDKYFNKHDLSQYPLKLTLNSKLDDEHIAVTSRIGLSKAVDTAWRFYVKDNPYISKL